MRRFQRRGQQEIPFHWIFALVGGALFLLFFFILIRSVTNQQAASSSRDLSYAVETIITTATATPDTFTVAELPEASYRIVCAREPGLFQSYVRVDQNSFSPETLRYIPVFSPSTVRGKQLFTSSQAWSAPFPVGSLVLVSNNDTRYVLAGPTDKTRSFVENENLGGFNIYRAGIGAIGSVKDEGYDQYRVVVFDYPGDTFHNSFPSLDSSLTKTKNTGLIIHLAPATENGAPAGTLDFYNDLSNQAKRELGVPFYGAAMLDAAIFSQDNATFLCNMVKAEERLNTTIKVLRLRLNDLAANQTVLTKCGDYLTRANDTLGAYALNPDAAFGEAADAAGSIEDLFNINQQAIGADCPQVI